MLRPCVLRYVANRLRLSPFGQDLHWVTKFSQKLCTGVKNVTTAEEWITKYPVLQDVKSRPCVFIIDQGLADLMVKKLGGDDLSSEEAVWIEVNPGPGVLTRALLEAGLPKLLGISAHADFNPELEEIKDAYPGRFDFFTKDFFRYPYIGDRYYKLLEHFPGLTSQSYDKDPPMKIICHPSGHWLNEKKFIRACQHKLIQHDDSLYSQGRVQLISLISGVEHQNLCCTFPNKRQRFPKNFIQHLLFDTESLLKVPQENLYPTPLMKAYKTRRYKEIKAEPFVLIRMTPKNDLFNTILSMEHLSFFSFFLQEMLKKSKDRLIPKVDIWFPKRGLDLIMEGYSMTDTIADLCPEDLLKIFKMMLSWPELHSSSFYSEYYTQASHRDVAEPAL